MDAISPIVCIVGQTASGKSALALEVAERQNGEIICADSQTVYTGLDILTAKPTIDEQHRIKHWCLSIADRSQPYNVSRFVTDAKHAISDISSRGKLPIIVGGSGLYVSALLYNFSFRPVNPHKRLRLEAKSLPELQLTVCSSGTPSDETNRRRLIRQIESETPPITQKNWDLPGNVILVGLQPDARDLENRIHNRLQYMAEAGVLQEVASYRGGDPGDSTGFQIYKSYLNNDISRNEMSEKLSIVTRQLAKKQRTWFKRDPNIHWFICPDDCLRYVQNELASFSNQQEDTRTKIKRR